MSTFRRIALALVLSAGAIPPEAVLSPAAAGGVCDDACLAPPRAPMPQAPAVASWPPGTLAPDAGGVARGFYDRRLTDMWKAEANGTCLGVLGNWKLTPTHIIAEGTAYELLAFAGSEARIEVTARRLLDYAVTRFTLVPVGRSRLDVVGDVTVDLTHYNAALRRC